MDSIIRAEKEVSEEGPFPGGQSGSYGGGLGGEARLEGLPLHRPVVESL